MAYKLFWWIEQNGVFEHDEICFTTKENQNGTYFDGKWNGRAREAEVWAENSACKSAEHRGSGLKKS